jgi:hypothetical protein
MNITVFAGGPESGGGATGAPGLSRLVALSKAVSVADHAPAADSAITERLQSSPFMARTVPNCPELGRQSSADRVPDRPGYPETRRHDCFLPEVALTVIGALNECFCRS